MSHDQSLLWRFRWSLFISSTSFPLSSIFYPHSFLSLSFFFLFFFLSIASTSLHFPHCLSLALQRQALATMDSLTGGQAKDVWMRSSNSTTTTTQSGERHFGLREKPGFTQAFFIFLLRAERGRCVIASEHCHICASVFVSVF